MAGIVIATLGSRGDLFPFIPIGLCLRARGHKVTFAAAPAFAPLVAAAGFPFRPLPGPVSFEEYRWHSEVFDPRWNGLASLRALMRAFILPELKKVVASLSEACRETDLLLTHAGQLASPMAAELVGARWATLSLFPGNIPSAWTVPQGALLPALPTPVGRAVNRAAWAFTLALLDVLFDRDLNAVRRELGLAPARHAFLLGAISPTLCLVLSSPRYSPRPADWPPHIRVTGFTYWDRAADWEAPSLLDAFLRDGPPPVVVTLGTALVRDPRNFFDVAASALRALGQRGVFLVGGESVGPFGGDVLVLSHVPLSTLLPRCAAIIHHGGAGTTAAALLAGRPAVVVPRLFDQPYHGARVRDLGVGVPIHWRRFTERRLRGALERVLERDYVERAARLAEELATDDGVGRACAEIERIL